MSQNITQYSEKACSGCGACFAICQKQAIQLQLNKAGFFEATVKQGQCIDCGLCLKVCGRFANVLGEKRLDEGRLYALQSSDQETVRKSSSGGIAHELALAAITKGYQAIGVVYNFDKNQAEHVIADSEETIADFADSKYLQSNPAGAFASAVIQARADKEKHFFVFGTPCQIAGLHKVLEQFQIRDQFLLTEIFCHGVPSYKLWEYELNCIGKKLGAGRLDAITFRYTKNDWHSYCLKAERNGKTFLGAREKELFWQVFFENILLGDSCYQCEVRKEKTVADLRIGDYWGGRFEKHSDGVSAVFAMTERGNAIIRELGTAKILVALKAGDAQEMLAAQNMAGYSQQKLHKEAMDVLKKTGDIGQAVKYYRSRMSTKQKLKRLALQASTVIPDDARAKLRKANSSRMLKR